MAVIINGDTGIDKITDGSVVNADIASGIDAAKLTGTLPAIDGSSLTNLPASVPDALSTASGSAPSYSARAWVNFNGTGTVAINASGNVSSVTDNAVGRYTINFATAMSDANYSVGAWARNPTTTSWNITVGSFDSISAPSASALPIWCRDHGTVDTDGSIVTVQVFR